MIGSETLYVPVYDNFEVRVVDTVEPPHIRSE